MEPTGDLFPPACIPADVILDSLQHQCQEVSLPSLDAFLSVVANAKVQGMTHLPGLLSSSWHLASTERGGCFPESVRFYAGVPSFKLG